MNDIESPSFCPFCGAQPFVSKRASGDGYNYSQLSQREISRLKSICDNCYSDIRTATNERLELTRDDVVAQRQAHQNELAKKRNANAQGTISARP